MTGTLPFAGLGTAVVQDGAAVEDVADEFDMLARLDVERLMIFNWSGGCHVLNDSLILYIPLGSQHASLPSIGHDIRPLQ